VLLASLFIKRALGVLALALHLTRLAYTDLAHFVRKHEIRAAFPRHHTLSSLAAPELWPSTNRDHASTQNGAIHLRTNRTVGCTQGPRCTFRATHNLDTRDDVHRLAIAGRLQEATDSSTVDASFEIGLIRNELCRIDAIELECFLIAKSRQCVRRFPMVAVHNLPLFPICTNIHAHPEQSTQKRGERRETTTSKSFLGDRYRQFARRQYVIMVRYAQCKAPMRLLE
jgi:hypothetical protein